MELSENSKTTKASLSSTYVLTNTEKDFIKQCSAFVFFSARAPPRASIISENGPIFAPSLKISMIINSLFQIFRVFIIKWCLIEQKITNKSIFMMKIN